MMNFVTMHRLALMFAFWCVTFSSSFAQSVEPGANANGGSSDPVFTSWQKQLGLQACGQCHYQPGGGPFSTPDLSFSRQNELQFWLANDKHAIARQRVEPLSVDEIKQEATDLLTRLKLASLPADWFGASNVLSRRICDKLGYDVLTPEGYDTFRNNCLTCHGGYLGERDNVDFAKDQGAQPGISCNYCHQIGDNVDWIQKHGVQGAAKPWRNLPPDLKAAAGMRDLVNVGTQAANCYDCHIGNREKNMFVTHVMYAAGHPPLPSIELQTFCTSMPQHWQSDSTLFESLKAFEGRDEYYRVNFPALFGTDQTTKFTPGDMFWNTRKMIVGAIAARLQGVQLMLSSVSEDRWADYSLYDCAACHHELREPSQRQARGYTGAPGRPRQSEWPETLLSIAVNIAGSDLRAKVEAIELRLALVFAQTPFGEPFTVASIGNELQALLEEVLERVQEKPIDSDSAREVIRQLASTPKDKLLVYDAGRQVVWAIQAIATELENAGEPLPAALTAEIKALGVVSQTGIEATLPAGRQVFIYPENLNVELKRRAAYSPDELVLLLANIASEIEVGPPASTAGVSEGT